MPQLSVIVPCYNCAASIAGSVAELSGYLGTIGRSWEIVLVNDGSSDATAAALDGLANASTRVVTLPANRGKGAAISAGMASARGDCRLFTDADLPYELSAIEACAAAILDEGRPIVFGNRLLPGSDATAQPLTRRLIGRTIRVVTTSIVGRRDVDTQCGLKAFSGAVADTLFPMLQIDGFLFDVEVALLLVRAGVPLFFVPVSLKPQESSTVAFLKTGRETVLDLWRLHRMSRAPLDSGAIEAAIAA